MCKKALQKFCFKKSRVNTSCVLSNEQSRALLVENDMSNVQGSICVEDDVSREHCIEDDCTQEEHARARIYECAKIISELYDSESEMHLKRIVDLLQAENFEVNGMR